MPSKFLEMDYRPRSHFMPLMRATSILSGAPPRKERWGIAVAHRRAGKTVACINELILSAATCDKPSPRFAYISPYFSQSKDIAWSYLRNYSAFIPGVTANESELRVDFPHNKGRVRLYGADNAERLRGIYLDGCVIDEIGDINPRAWSEVIRPALSDREGWCVFIGTPKGMNHFAEMFERAVRDPEWFTLRLPASQTGLLSKAELDDLRKEMSDEEVAAELECSFAASVVGAFYGKEMSKAEDDGRICGVPYEPGVLVDTWFDLGVDDATAVWFTQTVGREIHVIDCFEASGEGLPFYARMLKEKPYDYGTHNAPHDISVRELGSGKSRIETAASLGINFEKVPNIPRADGIDAARMFISRCWFDRNKTEQGRLALTSYRKVYDEKRKVFQAAPKHDWASNFADAFRYLAVGHKSAKSKHYQVGYTPRRYGGGGDHGFMGI
jgi:phage terminase large subunit